MTIGFSRTGTTASLSDEDDVLPILRTWRSQGLRTALVTLVAVEGGAPRQPGAQMAVAEDGRYFGYLSGGCLEQAVALEAQDVIRTGANRLVRYGRGSPYIDIKLPCGSGLDLYFDQALDDVALLTVQECRRRREACGLVTSLSTGISMVAPCDSDAFVSQRDGDLFTRIYTPAIRLALIGNGPAASAIATLAQTVGLETVAWSTDDETLTRMSNLGLNPVRDEDALARVVADLDAASAAVLVFHDHEAEPRILHQLLRTPAFYIGVLGNHAVHRARVEALRALGTTDAELARLHAPVGSIPNAKSKATFALGVLAELMSAAKARNLVA